MVSLDRCSELLADVLNAGAPATSPIPPRLDAPRRLGLRQSATRWRRRPRHASGLAPLQHGATGQLDRRARRLPRGPIQDPRGVREDLFYRLNVFQIHIAPLRQRPEDILPLAEIFLEELGRTMGRPAAGISGDARKWLLAYPWPGNVRELRNAIERAILLCEGGLITPDHLVGPMVRPVRAPAGNASPVGPTGRSVSESVDLGTMERSLIERALSQSKGNKSKAARLLGLTRAQLYSRLEKHGIR